MQVDEAPQPGSANPTVELMSDTCIAVRVRLLSRVITKMYNDSLRPLGIKASQVNILVVIGKLGLTRPAEICRRLMLDLSTVSRNVDRMVARGWIEVVNDEKDGRAHSFQLSQEGERLLEQVKPLWETAQAKAEALLGDGVVAIAEAAEAARNRG